MVGLVFLIILAWQFYIGYMRGVVLQGFYTLASLLSLVIANHFYKPLSDTLTLWIPYVNPGPDAKVFFFKSVNLFELDTVFYAGLAFAIVYGLSYIVFRFLGIFLHLVNLDKFDRVGFNSLSGILSILVTVLFFSMGTSLLATVPLDAVQQFLDGHITTKLLINLPIVSDLWQHYWVTQII